ncbi:MAG TPA: hypothetical protein VGH24_10235 [Solirubrobacteraceae bacterium]
MEPAGEARMLGPTAVYIGSSPTPEAERISKRMLDLRPGALIVVAPGVISSTEPPGGKPDQG